MKVFPAAKMAAMEEFKIDKAEFTRFFIGESGTPARIPVARLTEFDMALFGANLPMLWLSRMSIDEHKDRHPEVSVLDYLRIPDIILNADVWGGHKDKRFLLLTMDGKPYRAAIKIDQTEGEAWFLSLVISPKKKPPKGAVLLRKGTGGPGWRP